MIKKNYSELFEFTSAQLARLKKEYEPLKGKTLSMPQINKMNNMLSRFSKDMLIKLANTDIPFLSTSAKSQLVMKRGMKWSDFKRPLDMSEADELQCEACWTGYKQVGFKTSSRTGRRVPNCVPESVVKEMLGEVNDIRGSFSDAQLERMKQEWKNKPASAMTQGVKQMIMNLDAPTRAALENAKINHISKFAGSTFEQKEEVDPSCKICEGEACQCAQGETVQEASKYLRYSDLLIQKGRMQSAGDKQGEKRTDIEIEKEKKKLGITDEFVLEADLKEFKKMVVTIKDPIKRNQAMQDIQRFGKRTGFRIDKMSDGKSFRIDGKGADLNKFATDLKNFYGAEIKAESLEEADLSKSQVKMVHKKADDLSKKDFVKRYGKDGDSVRYATATNIVKKKLGIEEEEFVPEENKKGENMKEATYKDKFNAAMKDFGINSLDDLKSDAEKKKFFKKVDSMHTAKNEELTPAQKKLPAGLQKAIAKKQGDKEEGAMKRGSNLDTYKPKPKKEGFASDAQRKAAFASGYKEKGKKKDEMMKMKKEYGSMNAMKKMKEDTVEEMMNPQEMMKMNAMKMPIRAMYMKSKKEMKTGDDDMKPMASMKMNAMTDPKKMNAMTMQDPKQDMAAGYMKSDVRAAVKDGGGDDMAKVKDKPEMMAAMKKINATYKREKYMPVKEGSIQDTIAKVQMGEHQLVEVQEENLEKMIADYLKKGGTISKLPPALAKGMKPSEMKPHKVGAKGVIKSMKMGEVRQFVTTYNSHFLTNYKAEELLER
jgi:hypothetical protein